MSCIDPSYDGSRGVYCSVRPTTEVIVPEVIVPASLQFKPVDRDSLHVTLAANSESSPSRGELVDWLVKRSVTEETTWKAAAVAGVASWVAQERLYIGLEFYSPDLFSIHEDIKSSLSVSTDFPVYKCHMTFGSFRGLPAALLNDKVFTDDFVQAFVGPAPNNIIELSQLRFKNASQ